MRMCRAEDRDVWHCFVLKKQRLQLGVAAVFRVQDALCVCMLMAAEKRLLLLVRQCHVCVPTSGFVQQVPHVDALVCLMPPADL